ncbi:MAG: hypothetical protein CVV25_05455 [Ignavibacteriae bacterium HGW-Ignavibacteriae-4]|nr:MAG: hypothetical protein CVV25_05455 [Ignavibacteriae bacterium HGW-Ignavibacteriae-4]
MVVLKKKLSQRGLKGRGCLKITNFNTEPQRFVILIFHTKNTECDKPRHSDNAAGVRRIQEVESIAVGFSQRIKYPTQPNFDFSPFNKKTFTFSDTFLLLMCLYCILESQIMKNRL